MSNIFEKARRLLEKQNSATPAYGPSASASSSKPADDVRARMAELEREIDAASRRGDCDAICSAFEQMTRLAPNSAEHWCARGVALRQCNRNDEALQCYDAALRLDPNHTRSWRSKGVALAGLARLPEAFRCYERALALDPSDAMTWNSLGVAHVRSENPREARRCYEKSLELNSRSAETLANLLTCCYRLEDVAGMRNAARRLLAVQPNHPMAQTILQQLGG